MSHGYGLQTWEYSPEFAIRSWFYAGIHAVIGRIGSILSRSKTAEFYFIRLMLAAACAGCETRLFSVISRTLNPRIGILFLVIMAFSPGMLHASVAFLPSSFAMYTSMLGLASFMDWHGGSKTAAGIMWFGIGGIVGWPFAAALVAPFILEEMIISLVTKKVVGVARRFLDGIVRSLVVLVGSSRLSMINQMLNSSRRFRPASICSFIISCSSFHGGLSSTTSSAAKIEALIFSARSRGISIFVTSSLTSTSGSYWL